MNLALRLARREMRSGLAGFRLFIACLALGVAAIAGILSFSRASRKGCAPMPARSWAATSRSRCSTARRRPNKSSS